jgi:hypothetical protein
MISSHHALSQVTAELVSRINFPLANILLVLDGKPLVPEKSGLRPPGRGLASRASQRSAKISGRQRTEPKNPSSMPMPSAAAPRYVFQSAVSRLGRRNFEPGTSCIPSSANSLIQFRCVTLHPSADRRWDVTAYVVNGRVHGTSHSQNGDNAFAGHLKSGTNVFTFIVVILGYSEMRTTSVAWTIRRIVTLFKSAWEAGQDLRT